MYEESFKRQDKHFLIRNIRKEDINQEYIKLLQQLTEVNELYEKKTNELLDMLNVNHNICVIEDNETKKVIGTGTILIEHKLIRNNGKVAHIEDIVIDKEYRHYGLGKMLINCLTEYARLGNCYKCILDCSDENMPFYEKCGYKNKGVQMSYYF